jgi:hypothetical protein
MHQMGWENNDERQVDNDLVEDGHGPFQDTVPSSA